MTAYPIEVDGVRLPNPSTYDISYKDLFDDSTYTNQQGYLVSNLIRANQRTIQVSWTHLSLREASQILRSCGGKARYRIRFLDIREGGWQTSNFVPSDRSAKTVKMRQDFNGLYSVSFEFMEE